jgi:hypothetical protein
MINVAVTGTGQSAPRGAAVWLSRVHPSVADHATLVEPDPTGTQ